MNSRGWCRWIESFSVYCMAAARRPNAESTGAHAKRHADADEQEGRQAGRQADEGTDRMGSTVTTERAFPTHSLTTSAILEVGLDGASRCTGYS